MRWSALFLGAALLCPTGEALTVLPLTVESVKSVLLQADQAAKTASLAALCSASLAFTPLAADAAPQPTMDDAIVAFTEAAYPVIRAQNSAFPTLTEQIGALVFKSVPPQKMAKSIDLSLDALNSVPEETVAELNGVVREAFDGLRVESCGVVPLPPKSLVESISNTEAFALVDKAKLGAWKDKCRLPPELLPMPARRPLIALSARSHTADPLLHIPAGGVAR